MYGGGGQQVMVLNKNTKREVGRKAQRTNIQAAKAVASIIRTTLGPKAMLKMLIDPMGGIVMTNDGNAILREVDVGHPAAKNMIELSRAQDEEVGDGTTSVIILAGEMLSVAEPLLEKQIHPTVIVAAYFKALEESLKLLENIAIPLDLNNTGQLTEVIQSSIETKFASRWGSMISDLALKAARTVYEVLPSGKKEIDLKRYAKVEKIAGGEIEDCDVLNGVMFNKDVTHGRMRRLILNPRIVLLDCPLEYKKGESNTNVEITKESDWEAMLQQEEDEIKNMCDAILALKPDVVITEKGVSDLAQHFLMKANISCVRRVRKTDNNRIARVTGATIVSRTEELMQSHIGTRCGKFAVEKLGDDYFTFLTECENPKACTILLRGASKDVLNEMERNLLDAFNVTRNIMLEPKLLPGGGAVEMYLSAKLKEIGNSIRGVQQYPFHAVALALEVIPRTLAHNSGADVVRIMTELRAKHQTPDGHLYGISGEDGTVAKVAERGIVDTFSVKQQTIKTAIESAAVLLRIDDIVSGTSGKKRSNAPTESVKKPEDGDPDQKE